MKAETKIKSILLELTMNLTKEEWQRMTQEMILNNKIIFTISDNDDIGKITINLVKPT